MSVVPKYPAASIDLDFVEGDTYSVVSVAALALQNAGVGAEEVSEFVDEALEGDEDHLMCTLAHWVTVVAIGDFFVGNR